MKKLVFILLCATAMPPVLAQDNTIVPDGEGKIYQHDNVMLVRKTFSPESPMKRHNHPGAHIIVTVIDGDATFTINDDEQHHLQNGEVLIFDGNNDISGEFSQKTLITVTLIEDNPHETQ